MAWDCEQGFAYIKHWFDPILNTADARHAPLRYAPSWSQHPLHYEPPGHNTIVRYTHAKYPLYIKLLSDTLMSDILMSDTLMQGIHYTVRAIPLDI